MLKPIDLYILTSLLVLPVDASWTQARAAALLHVPQPAMTRALQRLEHAGLWERRARRLDVGGAEGLLVYGARFLIPAHLGPPVRGIWTAASAPPLNTLLISSTEIVWPDEDGEAVGLSLVPLHPSAPRAARASARLYAGLSIVDALRIGRVRDRALAAQELRRMIQERG